MNSSINIRKASPSDFQQILQVEISSFSRPYSPHLLLFFLHLCDDTSFIAIANEEVVGYVIGAPRSNGYGHVISIAVKPEWRRKGLGSKLMDALLTCFRSRGLKKAILEVAVSNNGAKAFYERLGFRVVSLLKNYYPWGEDAYLMIKDL